ncbi:Inositol hexakisphosphate and diphosphoinositol-p entakisphosphate kinase [Trichuris trichiura]|uniref:Inositol hexakisphosphate and diphosphoinositol-p entakisphosphate kinase n=1 Tax=Trichuris trichiura TaxID=36087 RepID=A0A077Z331_TRITR|nr:Inositol hexakisphosphate and diphosphoinositol-p entakisphosphate kinase [Trichuris trichiura]
MHEMSRKTEGDEQPNYYLNIVAVEEPLGARQYRQNHPGFRRQAVKYLRPTPALMSTAVISRGSSAPDLRKTAQSGSEGERSSYQDITFMVPPLRSLETLHNQLSLNQIDRFFQRIVIQNRLGDDYSDSTSRNTKVTQSL